MQWPSLADWPNAPFSIAAKAIFDSRRRVKQIKCRRFRLLFSDLIFKSFIREKQLSTIGIKVAEWLSGLRNYTYVFFFHTFFWVAAHVSRTPFNTNVQYSCAGQEWTVDRRERDITSVAAASSKKCCQDNELWVSGPLTPVCNRVGLSALSAGHRVFVALDSLPALQPHTMWAIKKRVICYINFAKFWPNRTIFGKTL